MTLVPVGDSSDRRRAAVLVTAEGRARITTVTFDLGGVLIDWDPRYLYRTLFDDEAEMEAFLAEVTTPAWNAEQDAGRPWVDAVDALAAEFPEHRPLIEAYRQRWPETLGDAIQGTVDVLADLRDAGVRLLALEQLVGGDVPGRARALPVPRLVRGHRRSRARSAQRNRTSGSSTC